MPRVMKTIADWNSRELFLVATTAIGLGIGYGTYLFGLSFAFGAFVAGMLLSESDFGYQALSNIIPLRDVSASCFLPPSACCWIRSTCWITREWSCFWS